MKVYFIGAGPGDPELLTIKAAKQISACKVCIWAGSLVNKEILSHLPAGAKIHDSASMSLDDMDKVFRQAKQNNNDIARIHTGDPTIYGAIQEQIKILDELEIEYEIIPGVSSFQASAATIKQELTMPEVSQTIILTRLEGRTPVPAGQDIRTLAKTGATICLFLSVGLINILREQLEGVLDDTTPAFVVFKASWPEEKIIKTTLGELSSKVTEQKITKTAMILLGKALGNQESVSRLYDKNFTHEYRKKK